MAGSVNKVVLIGRLGRDPESRVVHDERMAFFSLATTDHWTDSRSGERRERTDWHRVVVWNDRVAVLVAEHARKGHLVYVEGSLQTRKWTDDQGIERYQTEVVINRFGGAFRFLESRAAEAA